MQIILQREVPSLGREGDVVKVAKGYANNYLIPKGLAIIATPGNLKQLEQKQAAITKREKVVRAAAEKEKSKLDGKTITIKAKAGEEGRLYGSITTKDIGAAIEADLGAKIDKRRIELAEPIKQAGDVMIKIKLYPEVEASIEIKVIPELEEEEEEIKEETKEEIKEETKEEIKEETRKRLRKRRNWAQKN